MLAAQLQQDGVNALSHDAVPYGSAPRYLRLVSTLKHARDYASAGFHVSVTRALSGGCSDSAGSINYKSKACVNPLNRQDLASLWESAATAYRVAYYLPDETADMGAIKDALMTANMLADKAYEAEGIEPPRDPVLVAQGIYAPAEPIDKHRKLKLAAAGFGLAAVLVSGSYVAFRKTRNQPLWPIF